MQFENSDALNKWVAEQTGGEAILGFSMGKDSLAAYLVMRKYFHHIRPVFFYLVPGLEFVEDALAYYEKIFQTHITRLPNHHLYKWLNAFVQQAPQNVYTLLENPLPEYEIADLDQIVREDYGMPQAYAGKGVRARDSLNRWAAIKKYGPMSESKKTFFPIFDFTKADVVKTLRDGGIKLPPDYRMFGRTFDGLDYRFLKPIKDHYPRDFARICEFFPIAEAEIYRYEFRQKYFEKMALKDKEADNGRLA